MRCGQHNSFMCAVWISGITEIISLHAINWLAFITETGALETRSERDVAVHLSISFPNCHYFSPTCVFSVPWENTGLFKKMDSISYVYISWTIQGMWMIYTTFERGGPEFSNTTATAVQRAFRLRFNIQPPTRKSICLWNHQFEQIGCLCKGKSSGRPRVSEENVRRI
jgi:hypothetical protein